MQHHVQTVNKDYRCGSRKLSFESLTHCLLRSKVILCTRGLVQRLGLDGPDKTFSLNITDGSGSRAFRQKSLSVLQSDVAAACIELPEVCHLHKLTTSDLLRKTPSYNHMLIFRLEYSSYRREILPPVRANGDRGQMCSPT